MTQTTTPLHAASREFTSSPGAFMVDPPDVQRLFFLHRQFGWGALRISRELGLSRTTVRRYLRHGAYKPYSRVVTSILTPHLAWLKERFMEVRGNAQVLLRELSQKGVEVSYPTLARTVKPWREEAEALALATVRFETLPGQQCQVDFGELFLSIANIRTKVYFCVLTLGYSRRCFVRAFLAERQEHWLAALETGFIHFGGVPHQLLIDNPRVLVSAHNVKTAQVTFTQTFLSFCEQHGTKPRACKPFRPQTKGKVENGVGYVKKNGLAGQTFESFESLEAYLVWWTREVADVRIHGTTHEKPIARFGLDQQALLPLRVLPRRLLPVERKVAIDCFVNVDTNRYSVPYQYVSKVVQVLIVEGHICIRYAEKEIARHLVAKGRYQSILVKEHVAGLYPTRPSFEKQKGSPSEASLPSKEKKPSDKELLAPYAALQGGDA